MILCEPSSDQPYPRSIHLKEASSTREVGQCGGDDQKGVQKENQSRKPLKTL